MEEGNSTGMVMDPGLVIEALQHMKTFYNIDDGLVDKIVESIKSMHSVCRKRVKGELNTLRKLSGQYYQKSTKIEKENKILEKKNEFLKIGE
jgi:aspartate ammonia-lyase